MSEKPYWWPELFDAAKVREEIRNGEWCESCKDWLDLSDEDLQEVAANGQKYQTTWDHVGDAYEEYEPLADAFLEVIAENARLRDLLVQCSICLRLHAKPGNELLRDVDAALDKEASDE